MSFQVNTLFSKLNTNKVAIPLLILFSLLFGWFSLDQTLLSNSDETLYLLKAVVRHITPYWGPLYSFAYRFLLLFSSDKLLIYNFMLLFVYCFLWPISFYLLQVTAGATPFMGLLTGIMVVMAKGTISQPVKVHAFNISLIILAYLFMYRSKKPTLQLFFFVFLGASLFMRQDNLLIAGFFLAALFVFNYKKWSPDEKTVHFFAPVFFLFGYLICLAYFGSPMGRMMWAFHDHYILGAASRGIDPYVSQKLLAQQYGMFNFMNNHPAEFASHLLGNLRLIPERIFSCVSSAKHFFPESFSKSNSWFAVMLVSLYAAIFYRHRYFFTAKLTEKFFDRSLVAFGAALLLHFLSVCLLLNPRLDYIIAFSSLLFYVYIPWGLIAVKDFFFKNNNLSGAKPIFTVALLLWLVTLITLLSSDKHLYAAYPVNTRHYVTDMLNNNVVQPNDKLMAMGLVMIYAHPAVDSHFKFYSIGDYAGIETGDESLGSFLISKEINVFCYKAGIVEKWNAGGDIPEKTRAKVQNFIKNHEKFGYALVVMKDQRTDLECLRKNK